MIKSKRHLMNTQNNKHLNEQFRLMVSDQDENGEGKVVEVEGDNLTPDVAADFARAILGDNYDCFDCDWDDCEIEEDEPVDDDFNNEVALYDDDFDLECEGEDCEDEIEEISDDLDDAECAGEDCDEEDIEDIFSDDEEEVVDDEIEEISPEEETEEDEEKPEEEVISEKQKAIKEAMARIRRRRRIKESIERYRRRKRLEEAMRKRRLARKASYLKESLNIDDKDLTNEEFVEELKKKLIEKHSKNIKKKEELKESIIDVTDTPEAKELLEKAKELLTGQTVVTPIHGKGTIVEVERFSIFFNDVGIVVNIQFEELDYPKLFVLSSKIISNLPEVSPEIEEFLVSVTTELVDLKANLWRQEEERRAEEKAREEEERKLAKRERAKERRLANWDKYREAAGNRAIKTLLNLKPVQFNSNLYYTIGWLLGGHLGRVRANIPDLAVDTFKRIFGFKAESNPKFVTIKDTSQPSPGGWSNQWDISLYLTLVGVKENTVIPQILYDEVKDNVNKSIVACNNLLYTLILDYGFEFADLEHQDIEKIESEIPTEYLEDYLDGMEAARADLAR